MCLLQAETVGDETNWSDEQRHLTSLDVTKWVEENGLERWAGKNELFSDLRYTSVPSKIFV